MIYEKICQLNGLNTTSKTIKINKIPTLKENQFNFSPRRTYRRRKMNTSNVRPRTSIKKSSTQLGRRTR